jgi:hypothetical protein
MEDAAVPVGLRVRVAMTERVTDDVIDELGVAEPDGVAVGLVDGAT